MAGVPIYVGGRASVVRRDLSPTIINSTPIVPKSADATE